MPQAWAENFPVSNFTIGASTATPSTNGSQAICAGPVRQILADWRIGDAHLRTIHAMYIPGRHIALNLRALIDYLAKSSSP